MIVPKFGQNHKAAAPPSCRFCLRGVRTFPPGTERQYKVLRPYLVTVNFAKLVKVVDPVVTVTFPVVAPVGTVAVM